MLALSQFLIINQTYGSSKSRVKYFCRFNKPLIRNKNKTILFICKKSLAGLQKAKAAQNSYKTVGADINASQLEAMQSQLTSFQKNLEEFAAKYRKTINKNPEFRKHFQDMCVNIGVDPLASNKGFWAELLGVGDFYYELGVQIIEVNFLL